jgi:hypothetical protein
MGNNMYNFGLLDRTASHKQAMRTWKCTYDPVISSAAGGENTWGMKPDEQFERTKIYALHKSA